MVWELISYFLFLLQSGVDKGELLFSLQYLPTSCRLTVAVLKAKELKLNGEDTDLGKFFDEDPKMWAKTSWQSKLSLISSSNIFTHASNLSKYMTVNKWKSYVWTAVEEMNMEAILAAMNHERTGFEPMQ